MLYHAYQDGMKTKSTILDISLRDFIPSFVKSCDNVFDDISHVFRERDIYGVNRNGVR